MSVNGPQIQHGRERRAHDRLPCRCRILVHHEGGETRGKTIDVSAGGMLIALPLSLTLGVEVLLDMVLPDGNLLEGLRAMPVREVPVSTGPKRYGLHFIMPPEEALQQLRELIYNGAPA